jgi:chromosomal replication initiation ATPase DnaA
MSLDQPLFRGPASWYNDQTIHRPARPRNPFIQKPVPVEPAKPVQRDILHLASSYVPTLPSLLEAVCAHLWVPKADAVSNRRNQRAVAARQIYYYLAKKHTARSLQQIGRIVGGKDHTTVLHGCQKITTRYAEYAHDIEAIEAQMMKP